MAVRPILTQYISSADSQILNLPKYNTETNLCDFQATIPYHLDQAGLENFTIDLKAFIDAINAYDTQKILTENQAKMTQLDTALEALVPLESGLIADCRTSLINEKTKLQAEIDKALVYDARTLLGDSEVVLEAALQTLAESKLANNPQPDPINP